MLSYRYSLAKLSSSVSGTPSFLPLNRLEGGMEGMAETARGWLDGFIGMVIFSGSLPATRLAVAQLDPMFVTFLRAGIAGCVGAALLVASRQTRPRVADLRALVVVSAGVVIGFPLLTALALQHVSASHSLVSVGLLPLSTALFGVLRDGERPSLPFWLFSALGSAVVVLFALTQGGQASIKGDLLMFTAVILCGLGYAEGARLSRTLGGWQVVCWALVISLPAVVPLAALSIPSSLADIGMWSWGASPISLCSAP
jgi:drug/metabolite transporter (DMT)-like permease